MNINEIRNTIICGDCLEVMKQMPDDSVNCCISSPPYWGLRDYGVDGQLGLEKTPEEFIGKLVAVFREVRRVLKDDGTCWVNLGDSYANDAKWGGKSGCKNITSCIGGYSREKKLTNLKPKDLVGIPWRFAFAAQADGWYLRQDIIWHKPNPMPESVTDRCTKSHEYIFLLTKSARYFYDNEAIKEEFADDRNGNPNGGGQYAKECAWVGNRENAQSGLAKGKWNEDGNISGRNKRSVWTVTTKSFGEAHFATFPEKLIEPCVLAGCPEGGIILDPFFGAGTTGLVAYKNRRDYIGIELNPDYIGMSERRIQAEKDKLALFEGMV